MLRLAFFWHHHQPYYRDPITGRAALPWVRLHATKDYYGMARLISEFPKMRATINIVPSLAEQILRFADDGASDDWLDVMTPEVASLKDSERTKLVARGFHAHPTTMIGAFPRYQELQRKRLVGARFAKQDLLDLQVLANLAWMHGTLLAEDPLLIRLREKGRDFTEEDKRALLARQREIARDVLPMHRRLEQTGQIELTSTPYFHPILPLLCDFRSAFEAMPWLTGKLGFEPVSLKEDALVHVDRAMAAHERIFGQRPRGMWPAEGSVSMEAAQIFASRGLKFIATDEEILAQSLGRPIRRDGNGNVLDADVLYRPWRVKTPEGDVAIVFRDHRLSDLFGFQYQRDPAGAVEDFVRRLEWIRDRVADGALVSVILDGENAWEHYPEGGVPFLRALYRRLSDLEWLETVRIGDAIEKSRGIEALPRLFPGSWIDHNFYIWIGHEEDRRAWRALLDARRALVEAQGNGLSREKADLAWNAIYIAEGSDWYWWYGDDHSSGMDDIFDAIFRGQLKNVYELIGGRIPSALEDPIKRAVAEAPYSVPRGFSRVVLDGRRTSFYEWHGAGRFRPEQEAGSMERAQAGALVEVGFGFNTEELFLALDFGGRKHTIFAGGGAVHVVFITPRQKELVVSGPGLMRLDAMELATVAVDEIVELSLPWSALGAKTGDEVRFFVELRRDDGSVERTPRGFALRLRVPTDDFESREWSV
jgi:alpha-amylase/alpha-mannosidase (GH57 family)